MQIICPSCEEIIEIDILQLMDDGYARCPECRAQITLDDLDPDIFSDMDHSERGTFKSGSALLENVFEL
jgi:DNA-directed RNA polymerase subunit RPC12/RpoP